MKKHFGFWQRIFLIFGVIALLAVIYVAVVVTSSGSAQNAVEETRQALRKQGFKTDLSEFNFTVPSDQRGFDLALERAAAVRPRPGGSSFDPPTLVLAAGSNSAIVAWKEDRVRSEPQDVPWPVFIQSLEMNQPDFVAARAEALAKPIRFNLDASRGMAMRMPQLATMKRMSFALDSAMLVDLHEQNRDAAWTNLLAQTRLVTAWEPDATEIAHLVRFALASIAYDATWEALQADGWRDEQLAKLQSEWERVDFLKNLPETVAFKRAGSVDACQRQRKEPLGGVSLGEIFKELLHSPQQSIQMARGYWTAFRYLNEGTYDDEKALLLFYRDREIEMRNALQATNWAQMCSLPGVTNRVFFFSKYRASRIQSLLNLREIGSTMETMRSSVLGRAAESETRRRLILTAIALERFRIRHGKYPASLRELTPDFLKQPAIDFMDGQPLRYQPGNDGRFVLYSIGLDGVDNGGQIPRPPRPQSFRGGQLVTSSRVPLDLVWPRAATSNEIAALQEQELAELRQEAEQSQASESQEYWERTAIRQARAGNAFVAPESQVNGSSFNGRPVSELLRNENIPGTNTLFQMLTLHQVITGEEGDTITFEAPISYDALKNVGGLNLLIDLGRGERSDEEDRVAAQVEVSRATNGNCRLAWHTIFEAPGKHTLQMGLFLENGNWRQSIAGPILNVEATNICQFSESSAHFDSAVGAWIFAKVPELKANYSVEMIALDGKRVKTISGNTSNGIIEVFWDLIGDDQQKLKGDSFSTVFHITLPDSGRTQTLKGP